MRVLMVTHAEKTHFLGMVPLAWALRSAGHEVRVASQPALAGAIAGAGLTAVPVGGDHSYWRLMRSYRLFDRLTGLQPPFGKAAGPLEEIDWDYLREGYGRVVPWWWRLINDPMIDELTAFCRRWRPDLVIWGSISFAGSIAAAACGAAHARMLWGADIFARMRAHYLRLKERQPLGQREDLLAGWLGTRAAAHGVEFHEALTHGQFTIDYIPPSLRLNIDRSIDRVSMRYLPYNGRAVVPEWLRRPPDRPRICLSWGVSTQRQGEYVVSGAELIDALADLDIEVVALLPAGSWDDRRPLPDNARLVDFAPLSALLPTCAAMIDHGGWGTVNTGLCHGVPQVIVPSWFDSPLVASRLAEQGAALALSGGAADGQSVRESLRRILAESDFTRAAGRIRDEINAMPAPGNIVTQIENRTTTHRNRYTNS